MQVNYLVILDTDLVKELHGVARMDTCVPVHPRAYPWRKFIEMTFDASIVYANSSIFYGIQSV